MKIDPLDFFKKYELISSSNNYISQLEKSKVCRYCHKGEGEISFKEATHLLPELLGRNKIHTYDECDSCNSLFSKYETHLSIFIRPHITMLGVLGKKKIPAFHSRTINGDENTRTTLTYEKNANRNVVVKDAEDYVVNHENKTGYIIFRKQPFIPLLVYKSLVKIGLSLLPKEFDSYNTKVFEWISNRRNDADFITTGFITNVFRHQFNKPSANLYRAKNLCTETQEFPEHILILCFANQIIQIFLPFSQELLSINNGKRRLEINIFPSIAYENTEKINNVKTFMYDFNRDFFVKEDYRANFKFGSIATQES